MSGATLPPVRAWLRAEGAAVLAASIAGYVHGDYSWILFVALFLAPDLSLAGYLAGPRTGASVYNAIHSYVGPCIVGALFLATDRSLALPIIWVAHIGFDRLLGYGLKYPSAFRDTHLGMIGRLPAIDHKRPPQHP
jgi:hypothetical protein